MKRHSIKLLWLGGLILVVSAGVFGRVSNSLEGTGEQSELATFASLYKSSNPHILTTLFRPETEVDIRIPAVPATELTPNNQVAPDFLPYMRLHVTRVDNLTMRDGID